MVNIDKNTLDAGAKVLNGPNAVQLVALTLLGGIAWVMVVQALGKMDTLIAQQATVISKLDACLSHRVAASQQSELTE